MRHKGIDPIEAQRDARARVPSWKLSRVWQNPGSEAAKRRGALTMRDFKKLHRAG
jgi:hypothetical protein